MSQQPQPEQPERPEPWRPPPDQPAPAGDPPYGYPAQPPYGYPAQPRHGGGYPFGYPPSQYGYPPGGWVDPNDPLVTPPGAGIGGWSNRVSTTIQRSWRTLLSIMLITQVVPALAFGGVAIASEEAGLAVLPGQARPDPDPAVLGSLVAAMLLVAVLFSLISAVGWAAGTWTMTRNAAGEPAETGAALRYGLSRALGLWGWSLLIGLIVGVGVCACVLPGIYLAFALSLAGPVYLFERRNPIGRAFGIFHSAFGLVLGRVALVALVVIGGTLLVEMLVNGLGQTFGVGVGRTVGAVVVTVVSTVLTVPFYVVQLVGLVATYTEWRGRQGPVNTRQLVAELG